MPRRQNPVRPIRPAVAESTPPQESESLKADSDLFRDACRHIVRASWMMRLVREFTYSAGTQMKELPEKAILALWLLSFGAMPLGSLARFARLATKRMQRTLVPLVNAKLAKTEQGESPVYHITQTGIAYLRQLIEDSALRYSSMLAWDELPKQHVEPLHRFCRESSERIEAHLRTWVLGRGAPTTERC